MARKIAFNYEQALDKATTLFWQHGYAETGLRDLLKVMQIGESSFYNTLKSKKHLYLSCVEHYGETVVRRRLEALSGAATAAEGIRAFFRVSLDCLDDADTPSRLCLVAAMVAEEVLVEPELRECAENELEKVRGIFQVRLDQDRESGLLAASLDPQVTAALITTYLQGFWRMALVDYDRPAFERQIHTFLSALGL